jgi:hypothetical protein
MYLKCKCKNLFESDRIDNCPLCGRIPVKVNKPDKGHIRVKHEDDGKIYYSVNHRHTTLSLQVMARHF